MAQSAKALTGATAVNDATLAGTAEWIAGSDDEAGTVSYKGVSGPYRLDMTLRNGTRSEIVSPVSGAPAGHWIGLDGISHPMADHNLMVDAGWFPAFTLGNLLSSATTILSYLGQETRNNSQVIHIIASQQFPQLSGDPAALMQHLSQVDIYLDPSTLLPVCYVYNSHPDNDARLDIPTEIRYSNYQKIGGAQVPLRVQKSMNGSTVLDLQFQSAALNTGISVAQINAQ
ncbi:MAG TPA: hypothetical protein VG075_04390 [Candidatus Acidoferrum sp.]|nr:hypothetical protein [Candidatus Acidoferrum sp.]